MTTLEIVRGRLANGLTISDSDVHKLVAEIDRLRDALCLAIECVELLGAHVDPQLIVPQLTVNCDLVGELRNLRDLRAAIGRPAHD